MVKLLSEACKATKDSFSCQSHLSGVGSSTVERLRGGLSSGEGVVGEPIANRNHSAIATITIAVTKIATNTAATMPQFVVDEVDSFLGDRFDVAFAVTTLDESFSVERDPSNGGAGGTDTTGGASGGV